MEEIQTLQKQVLWTGHFFNDSSFIATRKSKRRTDKHQKKQTSSIAFRKAILHVSRHCYNRQPRHIRLVGFIRPRGRQVKLG